MYMYTCTCIRTSLHAIKVRDERSLYTTTLYTALLSQTLELHVYNVHVYVQCIMHTHIYTYMYMYTWLYSENTEVPV